ncbi:MAG TPA: DUF6596 domain-containing protein [Fimbriimonadaceae bacterium]|nr:DUF6596 domain-containing protein [Fimbriimonadaceae bacterium]
MALSDHFFRHESGRIVATLTKILGIENLDLAEDAVQDAIFDALALWSVRGVPANPSAWLITTAKNKALDVLRRERRVRGIGSEVENALLGAPPFELNMIQDDQLRLMFSCCHERLGVEQHVALILNLLGGMTAKEIAGAFVASLAATEKRIARAKKVLAGSGELFNVTRQAEFDERKPSVQRALYLLFNEGYHGASPEATIRTDLCMEAIRLTDLLANHPSGATPDTLALSALMRLHAARLPGRTNSSGDLTPLLDQDRSKWDRGMIQSGLHRLAQASTGDQVSEYHLEAMIAATHAQAPSLEETDWATIVMLYETLTKLRPSPVLGLNLAIAIGRLHGPRTGLERLAALPDKGRLEHYPFYWAAKATLEEELGQTDEARANFEKALATARSPLERRYIEGRLHALSGGSR